MQIRSKITHIAALIVISLAAHGQVANDASGLEGSVVNSVTGQAIPKALVELQDATPQFAFTDAGGRFHFAGPLNATSYVVVRKGGFISEFSMSGQYVYAGIRVNPDVHSVMLKLEPAASIHGRITSEAGAAIEGAEVTLFFLGPINGEDALAEGQSTRTDEYGEFRFDDLVSALYFVLAGPAVANQEPMPIQHSHIPARGYGHLFYPGVADPHSAIPIDLSAGQDLEANLTLPELPLFSVAGHITAPGVDGILSLAILGEAGRYRSFNSHFESVTGTFRVDNLPLGNYKVVASSSEGWLAPEFISLDANISDLNLSLARPQRIPIHIHAADRESAGAIVGVLLQPEDRWGQAEGSTVRPSGAGQLESSLPQPAPGAYRAHFHTSPPTHVITATCGRVDLLREPLVLSGNWIAPIEITTAYDSAKLGGHIQSQGQNMHAQVLVLPVDPPGEARFVDTDLGGKFDKLVLPPGSYQVWAFDRLPLKFREAEAMRQYASKAQSVVLHANDQRDVLLELLSTNPEQ